MISIIIIVKNDREIEKSLNALEKVKKPEKTEIIVIDASKKETLLDIRKKFPKVRWFYYENKTGKKITIPEQINMGVKKSKGKIIVFFDSAGCVVKENWLSELITPLLNGNEYFVSGLVKPLGKSHHILEKKSKYIEDCGGANSAIRRELFNLVGKRDTIFGYGSDIDFSWRARDLGYKIRYIPRAIMYHNWGDLRQEIRRSKNYGIAKAKIYKKHKNMIFKINFRNIQTFSYPIFILGLPITFFCKYYPLLLIIPFIKDFKRNSFKTITLNLIFGFYFLKEFIFGKNGR